MRNSLSIGRVIPGVLLGLAVIDIALRLAGPGAFVRSPAYSARLLAPPGDAFRPNVRIRVNRIDGDIAALANLPPVQQLGPLIFSTDAHGFRATPGTTMENAEVLVAKGRSFLFGAALSDDETLTAQLSRLLGRHVYNAGKWLGQDESAADLVKLLDRLPHVRRVVLLYIEREDMSVDDAPPSRTERVRTLWENKPPSPLRVLATRGMKRLQNGYWLPNRYADEAAVFRLDDGRRFLARPTELSRLLHPPDAETTARTADALAAFAAVIRSRGMRCVVALVPDKLNVYASRVRLATPADDYLARLEQQLQARGLEVVNTTPDLRRAANATAVYFLDDTHWTPAGVGIAANAIARKMHALQ